MKLLFISILFLLPLKSFSAGTDTIEITICESGCDYTSLDAALAGEARSLVTADSSILFKITGTWDNSDDVRARVIGFTSDPTRSITIRAEGDAAVSGGVWSETAYRLHAKGTNSAFYGAIIIDDGGENIQIYDLQLKIDTSRSSDAVINFGYLSSLNDSMVVRISGCLFWHYDDANISKKYINEGGKATGYNRVWNNMMWGLPNNNSSTNRGIESKVRGYYYNNTMHDGNTAYYDVGSANNALLYNNIVAGDFNTFETGEWSASSDYNATTLGTAMGGANDRVSQTFTFADTANDDFHLELTDAGARDYGKDLSADANLSFSDDIDNENRPYNSWDIGADEYRYVIVIESYTSNNSAGIEADSVMLGKPIGVQVGDLLLLIAGNDYNGASSSFELITGWTMFINIGNIVTDCKLACYWRIADGTEGDSIKVTTTEGLTDEIWGWYLRLSNVDQTTPINDLGSVLSNASASTHEIKQATSDVDSCLVIYALSFDGGDGYPFSESGTGWKETDEQQSGSAGNDASGCWGTKLLRSQGGAGAVTITSSVSDGATAIQFAIAPFTEAPAAEGKFIMIQQ